jgi:hypothetical protein
MLKVKYIGQHRPNDIIEVEEAQAKELLETQQYMIVEDAVSFVEPILPKKKK